jgi:hypothetical protein
MKALKLVLIACSFSAVLAHAQAAPADASPQQTAQNGAVQSVQHDGQNDAQRPVAEPSKKADDCVGPVSYCQIFFGR